MASDSPATTIASHSPKKGGFQAAGRRSPGSSLPSKISTEACRSRWTAFLWGNEGEGRRGSRHGREGGRNRPRPGRIAPCLPQEGMADDTLGTGPPQSGHGENVQRMARGSCPRCDRNDAPSPAAAPERRSPKAAQKTKTSHSMPGTSLQILVRETGLEPVWINRWILSPVRLPIPPLSQR